MQRESNGPILSTMFVDYDNIYLSLKRKSDDAAKRFSKDAGGWLKEVVSGRLITPTNRQDVAPQRRIVMNRCYGNPVPRRNAHDNSTDMNSFPFIRHNFLKSGFEVIDCPPLTAQLKNSADIRIVMDVRDLLNHDTYFDEFIILSGDADFTPLLHRLRAHARRTVVFANDHTAQPYTAISDGEIRESDLISLLVEGRIGTDDEAARLGGYEATAALVDIDGLRRTILSEIVSSVRMAPQPVPLEALADRAIRVIGHEKTVGSGWGGYGGFRDLLAAMLPEDMLLSEQPPYTVLDINRHITQAGPAAQGDRAAVERNDQRRIEQRVDYGAPRAEAQAPARSFAAAPGTRPSPPQNPTLAQQPPMQQRSAPPASSASNTGLVARSTVSENNAPRLSSSPAYSTAPEPRAPSPAYQTGDAKGYGKVASPQAAAPQRNADQATAIQQSIARIHEACQAPPLSPPEYRVLFDVMAQEITTNGLTGSQTLANIIQRAREFGVDLRRDDLRFILEVVSETDPWFEQGASESLFASRFRNFVVARCRSQGLSLSADELDLIEAWFAGSAPQQTAQRANPAPSQPMQQPAEPKADRWWAESEDGQHTTEQRSYGTAEAEDEFPRIVRSRLRG